VAFREHQHFGAVEQHEQDQPFSIR